MKNTCLCACPICGKQISLDNALKYIFDNNFFSELLVCYCNDCNLYFVDTSKNKSFTGGLLNYYDGLYRSSLGEHSEQLKHDDYYEKYYLRAFSQLLLIKIFWNKIKDPVNILDIGSGPGYGLSAAKKMFNDVELYAYEPDRFSYQRLSDLGVNVNIGFVNEQITGFGNIKFDIILMSHVLEHIEPKDLSQTVNNIYNCLSDDGLLLIEVPSDQYIISNNYTKSLEPHLSFFSIKSLEKLFGSMFDIVYCKESCGLLNTAVTQHKIEKKSIDGYWKVFTKWLLKKCDKYKKIRNTDVDNKRCFLEVFSPRYVICKIICIRRKCKRPDYFNVISSSYFSYGGSGRSVIRVVASKKILNLYKGSK